MKNKLGETLKQINETANTRQSRMSNESKDSLLTRIQLHNFGISMTAARHASFGPIEAFYERYEAFLNYLDDLTNAVAEKIESQREDKTPISPSELGRIRSRLASDAVLTGIRSGNSPKHFAERIYDHPHIQTIRNEWVNNVVPNEAESYLISVVMNQTRIHDELNKILSAPNLSDPSIQSLALGQGKLIDDIALDVYRLAETQASRLIKHMESESNTGEVYGQLAYSAVRSNYVSTVINRLRYGADKLASYLTDEWEKNPLERTEMMVNGVLVPWLERELDFNSAALVTMLDQDPRILTAKTYFRDQDAISNEHIDLTTAAITRIQNLGENENLENDPVVREQKSMTIADLIVEAGSKLSPANESDSNSAHIPTVEELINNDMSNS